MADVLDGKFVIPAGTDYISRSGVQEIRTFGKSVANAFRGLETAYDVAVRSGFEGTVEEWLDSLIGPRGEEGPYGGTVVADPQVAQLIAAATSTRKSLDDAFRTFVSVREYGATGDGATDDTDAMRAAITSNPGQNVHFPPGRYVLTDVFDIPAGTILSGAGKAMTTLDWSGMAEWTNGSIDAFLTWEHGSLTDPTTPTVDIERGSPSITVPSGHPYNVGDIIRLTSTEIVAGEAVKAEFQRIVQIDGGTLHLSTSTFDSYDRASDAKVERVNLVDAGISGMTIVGKGLNPASLVNDGVDSNRGDSGVQMTLARNVTIADMGFEKVENRCVRLNSCLGAEITDVHFMFDPARVRLQYGISINGATQMVSIRGCSSWNDRHMVTTSTSKSTSSGYEPYRGVPRVITITGCTAHGSWQNPIDTHRGGEYLTIVGNALTTEAVGVKVRGTQILVADNVMLGKRTSIYDTSLTGVRVLNRCEDARIAGNLIRGFYNGVRFELPDGSTRSLVVSDNSILDCDRAVIASASSSAIAELRISGNTLRSLGDYPVFIAATVTDLEIVNNVLEGGQQGMRAVNSESEAIVRALIQGNVCRGQSGEAMYLRNISDALVTGNFAPGKVIQVLGSCPNVVAGVNHAVLDDQSSPGITQL